LIIPSEQSAVVVTPDTVSHVRYTLLQAVNTNAGHESSAGPSFGKRVQHIKDAWMHQKLWKDDNFIEVLSEDCPPKVKAKVVETIHQYLDLCVTFPLTFP